MEKIKSRRILFILLALTGLSFIPLRSLKFEFNIERLFPQDDPDLVFFRNYQSQFQSTLDDEFILIGLKPESGIFNRSFLEKADSLSRFITRLENVIKVYSVTSSNVISFNKEEINARPLINIYKPESYQQDSIYLFESKEYRDLLVSRDGRSIAIAAFNRQYLTDDEKDLILNSINQKIDQLSFNEHYLAAKIRIERIYVEEIKKNLKIYFVLSFFMISMVLFILFRSVKSIITPLIIIVVSIIWTLSFISLTGHSLDIISSLLPPILAAICMSDVIHLSTHYIENLRSGLPKQEALNKTYKEIGLATFYTCCIVATGFFTLGITDILPIRNFGFFAGIGLFIAFGISVLTLYSYYTLTPVPDIVKVKTAEKNWNSFLASAFKKVIRYKFLVLAIASGIALSSVYFISKIEINSSLLQEIPKKHPVLNDFNFMEKEFSGTRSFELELSIKENTGSFLELQKLKLVEQVESFVKDSLGVGNLISPLSLFRGANKSFYGGDNIYFHLPKTQEEVNRFQEAIYQTEHADVIKNYLSEDGKRLRISGRLPDLSLKEFKSLEEKFYSFSNNKEISDFFTARLTGSALLLDKATMSLTKNLFKGIIIDIIIISLIALLLLRYWRIIFIVLIPNTIPLLIMAAMMGILNINLKADTSVIFAIAFGIATDDTIHFISRLRLELSKGLSLPYAVKRTYISTGKAIIITTLVLLSGFSTLLFSSFGGAFYIGLLISLCLFTAMIMELTVTPLLVLLFYKSKKKDNNQPSITN
jgi:uncharacterized protein